MKTFDGVYKLLNPNIKVGEKIKARYRTDKKFRRKYIKRAKARHARLYFSNAEYKRKMLNYCSWSLYGHGIEVKEKMVEEQKGKCFICNKFFLNSKDTHMDHNHQTNKPRKVLCTSCNLRLDRVEENKKCKFDIAPYLKYIELFN